MSDLLKRRIAARQRIKEAGGHTFTLRRPTEFEKVKFASLTMLEYLSQCIDDCDLTEADLFDGGNSEAKVPFERGLLFDWLQENPELWTPLMDELRSMVDSHAATLEEAAKN